MSIHQENQVNVYDFDHTIYRGDSSLDFIIYCLRRHPLLLRYIPILTWALLLFMLGRRSRRQVKQVAFSFLKELNNIDLDIANFWSSHEHKLEKWYLDQKQSSDLIISASPEFLLQPILDNLKVKNLLGTKMNKKTGKISGENCRADEKIIRLKKHSPDLDIMKCYSDTVSDAPLLSLAKHAYLVKRGNIRVLGVDDLSKLKRRKLLIREIVLYGIIGVTTAALDITLFRVFRVVGIPLLIANFLSVSTAIGSSFILNAKYNFKKTDNLAERASKFFAVGYFGWFVQTIILWIGVSIIGISDIYVKIFAVFIAAAIQYVLNKFLTFKD